MPGMQHMLMLSAYMLLCSTACLVLDRTVHLTWLNSLDYTATYDALLAGS